VAVGPMVPDPDPKSRATNQPDAVMPLLRARPSDALTGGSPSGSGGGSNVWTWSPIMPNGVSFFSLSRQAKGFIARSPGAPANAMEIRGEADVSRATR
jgi:hypothetical protein